MEVEEEEPIELLFDKWYCENTGSLLPLVRKCISAAPGEKEVLRALELAFSSCLKNCPFEELEDEIFELACPVAVTVIEDKLKLIEKNPKGWAEPLGVALKIISYFHSVFEHLDGIPKFPICKVQSFLSATSEVLLGCISHCKICSRIYGSRFAAHAEDVNNFFKKCCIVQKQFLKVLAEKLECNIQDHDDISFLSETLSSLSKSGFALITLELKTMAEVWKTFVFLTDKYLSSLRKIHDIGETIKELCCGIVSNVSVVLTGGGQDFDKIIKLSCFLLKLVIKFCTGFAGNLRNCHPFLLNLLLKLYKWDATVISSTSQDLINQLTIGTEPLLTQLLVDEAFIRECCIASQDVDKAAEFSILCCSVLKKLLDGNSVNRNLWFNDKKNILEWIFVCASSCHFTTYSNISLPSILVNRKQKKFTDLYEYVLVTTSAFLMISTAEEYQLAEETLMKSILQTNPVRALLAIDIWCLLARFADSELCFSQLLTLSKVYHEFQSGTFRVEKWHLVSLIQRLFPLLTERHRTDFLKSSQPSFYSSIWEGGRLDCFTAKEACDVCEALLHQVDHLMDGFDGSQGGKVLPTWREGVMHEKFGGKILKLWKFNCEVLSSTPESVRFLKIACALTGCIVSEMQSGDLLMVLNQMKTLLALGQPTCTKLYFTWVLNSLSTVRLPPGDLQKEIITTTADIFKNLLSSREALVKQKAFETFYSFAHKTSHGEVISMSVQNAPELKVEITDYLKKKPLDQSDFVFSDYITELCHVSFRHSCPEIKLDESVLCKKLKLENPDAQDIVNRWTECGKKILQFYHLLTGSQKREVESMCHSILSMGE